MDGDTLTVTVIRPAGRNPFGDDIGSPLTFDIEGCKFAPGPSREPGFASLQVTTDGTVYGPPGMDIQPTDRMLVRGKLYSVIGEVQDWGSAGSVVVLQRHTG